MTTFVALLRSVNVAGHGRLAMTDLKEVFVALGYTDVATYIQTGNVIFTYSSRSAARLESAIERQLERTFGTTPKVILRTVPELAHTVAPAPTRPAVRTPHGTTSRFWPPHRPRIAWRRSARRPVGATN